MFYILQIEEDEYIAHHKDIGWFLTDEKDEANQFKGYELLSLLESFDDELEFYGHFTIENHTYEDYTILECQTVSQIIQKENIQ